MRTFWKCRICLCIAAVDERPNRLMCSLCNEEMSLMGEVKQDKLIRHEHRCPCDARCTNAQGPNCECQCGGANHGRGFVVVPVIVGGVPQVTPIDDKAISRRDEFIAARDAAWNRIRSLPGFSSYDAGVWLPHETWSRLRNTTREFYIACGYRVHTRRVKELLAIAKQ